MPRKINLHVSTNNNVNGVLNVKVSPWRIHLGPGDVVEWQLDPTGPAQNDILWFRVEQIDQAHPWPFNPPTPPDARYTALAANGGIVTSTPRNNDNPKDSVISYALTIAFNDDNGNPRTMYIDPDMIID